MTCQIPNKYRNSMPGTYPVVALNRNGHTYPSIQPKITAFCDKNNIKCLNLMKHHIILRCKNSLFKNMMDKEDTYCGE